jgi:Predicted coiled-coil domain-containing protein
MMSEHLAGMNERLTEQKDEIDVLRYQLQQQAQQNSKVLLAITRGLLTFPVVVRLKVFAALSRFIKACIINPECGKRVPVRWESEELGKLVFVSIHP